LLMSGGERLFDVFTENRKAPADVIGDSPWVHK
jgi:hypothetical protein